ncbi:MAG: ATP-binding protein [Bacteroidetes bacterium]|nr:ATP-binding protein [Bacteroidota bacterium]
MKTKRIVITGGPATGKTSLIDFLNTLDYPCFPEIIREFTIEETEDKDTSDLQSNPIVFADDSLSFNQRLIDGRDKQYQESLALKNDFIFFDRGLPDVLAYMDFFGQTYESNFTDICQRASYDRVFILPPWKEIFEGDGERYETFDEASLLHNHLVERYTFFGNPPIEVPKGSVKERIEFILKTLDL